VDARGTADAEDVPTRARRPSGGFALAKHGSKVERWASQRHAYIDNLKVLLIAGIIAGHAVASYSEQDFWSYSEMKEVELSPVTQGILYAVVAPATLMMIPLLFLVAGLLTPGSMARKGPGRFAEDRLLRLGVPFAVYVLLLQPLLMYPVHPPGETPGSYWFELIGGGDQTLDTGPLWFVGVLLVFSLLYAAWIGLRRGHTPTRPAGEVKGRHLLGLAGVVAVVTFLIRLEIPLGGSNKLVSLNLWEWPACAAAFALGIIGFRRGWLVALPDRLHRRCRAATIGALIGFAVFAGAILALGLDETQLWGGWNWLALLFVTLESVLVVFGSLWLLLVAQRHLDREFWWSGPKVRRSAYGAFMLQGVPLIGLAFAMRPLPLPAEVKALLLAVTAVAGSFTLAWLLLSRVPGLTRVL
jgi:Acyltransferase family